jgi:hypothetical protein
MVWPFFVLIGWCPHLPKLISIFMALFYRQPKAHIIIDNQIIFQIHQYLFDKNLHCSICNFRVNQQGPISL